MIKASAPGNFAFIGDPADMFGGSVISCSLRERAHCTLDDSPLQQEITIEVAGQKATIASPEDLQLRGDPLDLPKSVLWALEVLSTAKRPFALVAHPIPTLDDTLAGPTAMLTAIAGCVLSHIGLHLNVYETAELVRHIETDMLRSPCGFRAQYAAAFGGICYMDFRGKDCAVSHGQEAPFATVEPISAYVGALPVLVATLADGARSQVAYGSLETAGELEKLTRLAKKALLAEQWNTLGDLINRSHATQREIAGQDPSSESIIQAALAGGAIGARRLADCGSMVVVTLEPERTAAALMDAGAQAIHFPAFSRGLTIEIAT